MKRLCCLSGAAATAIVLLNLTAAWAADTPLPPSVLVVAPDPCAAEAGSAPATFLVVRTGPATAPLTVQYTLGGTAENGADYELLPGSVTIPANAWFAPITVTPIDDSLVEGLESVVLALQQPAQWPPPYRVTWPAVACAQIEDNDPSPVNQPPRIALRCPPDGAIFDLGEDILLVAGAFDPDGRVVTAEFFADGNSLGIVNSRPRPVFEPPLTATSDPALTLDTDLFPPLDLWPEPIPVPAQIFRLLWTDPKPGPHVLTAVATDDDGATAESGPVKISVLDTPPQPVVTIRASDPIAAEPGPAGTVVDTATFTLHRSGPTNFPLQVWCRIGGTATQGLDYKSLPGSFVIPVGERTLDIIIEPLDDLLVEGPESVVLTIVPPLCIAIDPPPPDCYRVGLAHTAKAIILDNDSGPNQPPLVKLVKPEAGAIFLAPADIRLAALAQDFDGYVVTVQFFEGANCLGIVTNRPLASAACEPAFSLLWTNVPPGHYVLTAQATDNDGGTSLSRPVEIIVSRGEAVNLPPRVAIVTPEDGSVFPAGKDIPIEVVARDPDGYVPTVQFYANDKMIGEQTIMFFVPPPPGEVQKFSMVWPEVPAGEYVLTAKAIDDQGAASVSDPVHIKVALFPPLPIVTLTAPDPVATEPNPLLPVLPDTALFKVCRTGSLQAPLRVCYQIGGTAENGVDYQKLTGEVIIPADSASAPIELVPIDDNLFEGCESVVLTLSQPPCTTGDVVTPDCYNVGEPRRAYAWIRDNDAPPNKPPTVAILSPANGSVYTAPVDIRLVAAAGDPDGWVVTVEFFDGNTSLGIVTNKFCIFPGLISLPDLGSMLLPENTWCRPFSMVWSNVPPGQHVLTAVATDNAGQTTRSSPVELNVLEDSNLPVVRITAPDPIAREGTLNTASFRLRRFGSTNEALTVHYDIQGTAVNGVDYVSIPTTVTIPAGHRTARVLIQPIDDEVPEAIETVRLRITTSPVDPPTYIPGRPQSAAAIILDNDCSLVNMQPLPDGNVHLRMPVPVGMPFRLEASSNLLDWQPILSDIATTETARSFVEPQASTEPQRFFRIVQEFGTPEGDD